MPCDRYLIIPAGDYWSIQLDAAVLGMLAGRSEAIQPVIAVAFLSGTCGNQTHMLTKGPDREFMPIWTSGLDGYSAEV
jgi:hypothetical protein